MSSPAPRARRRRLLVALTAAITTAAASATIAQAAVITECTRTAVASAVAAGGSHTFACDGRIVMSSALAVSTTVSFDATGRDVTFAGSRPGEDTTIGFPERDNRVLRVTPSGALTLRAVDVEDGVIVTPYPGTGRDGTSADRNPTGANGPADANAGPVAAVGRGGCVLVEAGGRLILRDLSVRRCQAVTGRSGTAGKASEGGGGRPGTNGLSASYENPGNGAAGTNGSRGGNGAVAVAGVAGSTAEGGAVYSAGTLDIADVRFEDNLVRGGRGGRGGDGGGSGYGGQGGHGGNPYGGSAVGGDGGNAGPPGAAQRGGLGGRGGAGRGGAVYAVGSSSIVRAHFARNAAHGGAAGSGGLGGRGNSGLYGTPGRIQTINGTPDPACSIPGDRNYYLQCGRHGTSSGSPGADGGGNGDAGDALGGAVFLQGAQSPPLNTTNPGP